jgi:hypothetical protein
MGAIQRTVPGGRSSAPHQAHGAHAAHDAGLRLVRAVPRYYPSQRWILSVPGMREALAWNCLVVLDCTDASARDVLSASPTSRSR